MHKSAIPVESDSVSITNTFLNPFAALLALRHAEDSFSESEKCTTASYSFNSAPKCSLYCSSFTAQVLGSFLVSETYFIISSPVISPSGAERSPSVTVNGTVFMSYSDNISLVRSTVDSADIAIFIFDFSRKFLFALHFNSRNRNNQPTFVSLFSKPRKLHGRVVFCRFYSR